MWLLSKFDLVSDLIDFMLGDKSPRAANEKEKRISMGGSANMPQFGPLVKLVCHLVRSQYTQAILDNKESQPDTFALFKDEKSADAPKTMLPRQYVLSAEAYQMITNTDFLELCVRN